MNRNKPIDTKPLQLNWLGQWVEVQETEQLTSYTQVLRAQEAEPHYAALMAT